MSPSRRTSIDPSVGGFPTPGFPVHRSDGAAWPELDVSLLEDRRGAVPPLPLDLLPQPWRGWVADTARAAGAPADYVAQPMLAAAAGLCSGASVRVVAGWSEPLVLRQALVGGPASGKSSALAPVRGLLATIEADDPAEGAKVQLEWHDAAADWLGDLGAEALEAWGGKRPPSVVGTIRPDVLEETLQERDAGLAGHFLYAWPEQPPYCPLFERKVPRDDEALHLLRRLHGAARRPDDALVLSFDEPGAQAFDRFLSRLHVERPKAEGLEAAWLGRGGGTVARLAGVLELLAWAAAGASGAPGPIGRERVEAAASLWSDYFRAHARAVFDRAAPSDLELRVRRVARWLKEGGQTAVSREDIRRDALRQSVKASEADMVIYRLAGSGILRSVPAESSPRGGPRVRRWEVNPALASV